MGWPSHACGPAQTVGWTVKKNGFTQTGTDHGMDVGWPLGRIFMRFLGVIKACNAVLEVFMYVQLIQVSNLDRKRGFDSRN